LSLGGEIRSRLKTVFAALLLSLVPMLALGLTLHCVLADRSREMAQRELRVLIEEARRSLERFFGDRVTNLRGITLTQSRESLQDRSQLISVLKLTMLQSKSFLGIEVIGHDGDRVVRVGHPEADSPPHDYGKAAWFDTVMSSGIYIGDVFVGAGNVPQMVVAVSKQEESGSWAVLATIRTDYVDQILASVRLAPGDNAFVVNTKNVLQAGSGFPWTFQDHAPKLNFTTSVGVTIGQRSLNGDEILYGTASLGTPSWVLVITQNLRGRISDLPGFGYYIGIILGLSTVLTILGTVLFAGWFVRDSSRPTPDAASTQDSMIQWSKMAALGKMAAGIAHEINNPLAIIGESAGWMIDLFDEEDVRESANFRELKNCVDKIRDQVDRCKTVTHHLLRFGRRLAPIHETVDVNQILSETVSLFESEAYFREIEIRKHYDPLLPRVSTDPTQLQQVFLNIIDNALDAVGNAGSVTIKTVASPPPGNEIVIEISDTGQGMPKAVLGHIFDPFFTTKKTGEGLGLGLSVSYGIIKRLGGDIRVSSEEARGTTFTITLPVV
jgi:two-component system, NtrC family, sensor kinase